MMTLRTKDALYQLEKFITTESQKKAFDELKAAVSSEIAGLHTSIAQTHSRYDRVVSSSFLRSVPGQRVLARAMQADPIATELDLLEGGARDLAAMAGSDYAAEKHRQTKLKLETNEATA